MRNRTHSRASDQPQIHKARTVLGSGKPKRPRIEAAADEATLYVYDYIGFFGVEAEPVVRALAEVTASTIHVRINSPGGDVFDGMSIYNALKAHAARIVVHVDGLAASIASVIAMSGDEIRMAEGSFFMIHNPWTVALGDAGEMRKTAEILDKVGGSLLNIYAERTGEDRKEIQRMMDEETWFNAEEAEELGFADTTENREVEPAAAFDLSVFSHVPEGLAIRAERAEKKGIETIRDLEKFLRDEGGFSHAQAKKIAAGGFKPSTDPRDEDGEAITVADISQLIATLSN